MRRWNGHQTEVGPTNPAIGRTRRVVLAGQRASVALCVRLRVRRQPVTGQALGFLDLGGACR